MTTGAQGGVFVMLVFLAAMLFALGTGTSTGTCIALSPVVYPAGYFLGADPAMLGLAILSGAAFGDNLAPISDTTIVSAYTQGAEMRDVVRSRFPLAISAASISAVVFLVFGGGGEVRPLPEMQASLNSCFWHLRLWSSRRSRGGTSSNRSFTATLPPRSSAC